jgi:S-adenosylmethionine hydrolase
MSGVVAIISDYGLKDYYVGTVHGVVKSVSPEITVVDITHNVRPFDLVDAAVKLKWSFKYFPRGTVFLVLVDPDPRAEPIIVTTERYFVVSPNNGVGSLMFEEEPPETVFRITAEHYFLKGEGNFRGRNQLAPIAAELSRVQSARHFGDEMELSQLKRFRIPSPVEISPGVFEAIVLDVDNFGNVITNFKYDGREPLYAEVGRKKVEKVRRVFTNLKKGEVFISITPEGYFQIVAYMSNASQALGLKRGMRVRLVFKG